VLFRSVRTTFAFFLVVLLVGFLALHGLVNLLQRAGRMRRRWRHWSEDHRRRRAHESLAGGLMAMAGGDYARAERLFRRGVDERSQPEAHYLAAAEAAHAARAPGRRDNYLTLAAGADPGARTALTIKRAAWLLENGQLSEARPLIEKLAENNRDNPRVLALMLRLAQASYDHAGVFALVPDLRRDRVLGHDALDAIERESAIALLARADLTREVLESRWQALGKHLRTDADVISAYVRGLCRHGDDGLAEELVRKRLERRWDTALAALYGEIACEPPTRQLRKLESWTVQHAGDPGLRLAHARLAIRAGQWDEAREQVEGLIDHTPSPLLHELLAEIAEGKGDGAAAARHRKAGLELAIGVAPPRSQLPVLAAGDEHAA
ncbi:MAG: heme biosynthesis HemY N-terminal domain-containing protein, partial [Gammaproteobacteria bacterium]